MPQPTIRIATDDDFEEFMRTAGTGFLQDWVERTEHTRKSFAVNRFHVAVDPELDQMIGTCGYLDRWITVPGAAPARMAAVTAVAVRPGHRRRGVLTGMMRAQLDDVHRRGDAAIATLWASEAVIYGRFGYGSAANFLRTEIPSGLPFRSGVDLGPDPVRELPRDAALPRLADLYPSVAATRPGWLNRNELDWSMHLEDVEEYRDGWSPLRFALHPEGYATFRTKRGWGGRGPEGQIQLHEMTAATPVAAAALWRYLLDYDLIRTVHAEIALDDPILRLITDQRQVAGGWRDSLWVRLVDVDRALTLRRYAAPTDVVLELTDAFCPWNAGRLRLTAGPDGVAVQRTSDPADLALDVVDLGAVYLGGPTLLSLADVGRVRELTPGALGPASRAFVADRPPHCPEPF